MKKKFNQSNIKVAIASAIMVSSVSLGTAGNAAEEGLLNISVFTVGSMHMLCGQVLTQETLRMRLKTI